MISPEAMSMVYMDKLHNVDCMDMLFRIPDNYFELAIVDPPYGLGNKLIIGGTWSKRYQKKGVAWDIRPSAEYFNQLKRVSKNWIVWGSNYFASDLGDCRSFITWHKPYMDGMNTMSNCELAFTSFDRNAWCVSINKDKGTEKREHVCQKPIALYKWLLTNYAKPGDKILDTHVGSGSSIIACMEYRFQWCGFEIDKTYFDKAQERIDSYANQCTMDMY